MNDYQGPRHADPACEDERRASRIVSVHCDSCGKDHESQADCMPAHTCPHCGEDYADAFWITEVEDSV